MFWKPKKQQESSAAHAPPRPVPANIKNETIRKMLSKPPAPPKPKPPTPAAATKAPPAKPSNLNLLGRLFLIALMAGSFYGVVFPKFSTYLKLQWEEQKKKEDEKKRKELGLDPDAPIPEDDKTPSIITLFWKGLSAWTPTVSISRTPPQPSQPTSGEAKGTTTTTTAATTTSSSSPQLADCMPLYECLLAGGACEELKQQYRHCYK